jgi:AcrR family transcriptional regulator
MPISADKPERKRNAAATRDAILTSAHAAFVRAGYDGVGVREIAAGAGVTAMLVNRYFGSKEKLFAEVMSRDLAAPTILTPETLASPTLAADMARLLVAITAKDAGALDGFQMMLRSAASERAAELGRDAIEAHHQRNLTRVLQGPHAAERAALILSLVAGVQVMRQMIGLDALAKADPEVLARLIEPVIAALMAPPGRD